MVVASHPATCWDNLLLLACGPFSNASTRLAHGCYGYAGTGVMQQVVVLPTRVLRTLAPCV